MKVVGSVVVIITLVMGVGACNNSGRSYVKSEMVETLDVEIRPNTSKMFTYRLRWPEELIPSHIRIANSGGSSQLLAQQGVTIGRGSYERLLRNATYVVKQAGYCREGFLELDHSMSRYHLWLKGECKESATPADQQQFGPSQTLTTGSWSAR